MAGITFHAITAIISLQTLTSCFVSTIGQYIYAYYLQTYQIPANSTSNYTTPNTYLSFDYLAKIKNQTNECSQSADSPNKDAQAWAQQQSADLFFWVNLMSSCPAIVVTYFLGLYTPKLGKRFVLILPIIGTIGQLAVWLAIMYFGLPDFWWYIAAVITGVTGSAGSIALTLTLIITENTLESERSSSYVRIVAIQTGLGAVVTFGIGYYIGWRGFTDLYWFTLALQILSIIIVILFFKTTGTNLDERTPLLSSTNADLQDLSSNNCSNFFSVCTVFRFNRRSKEKSISLYLTLFSNIFYTLALSGFASLLWYLLSSPFCWTSKDIGNYSALGAISSAILSLIGMQLLTYVGASDAIICVFSQIFFCVSTLWVAFAQYGWQLYIGLFITAFSGYQGSLSISMMSKWLEPHERNNAFTFVTIITAIVAAIGSSLFSWVYARTVVNHRNFTLLLSAAIGVIPFILNIWLYLVTRKMSDEDVPPLSQTDAEPAPLRIPSNRPTHAGDPACILIPSRSLITYVPTPPVQKSRTNSIDNNATEDIIYSSANHAPIVL